uniref:Uncharacterized protein n=1 Tax=Clastoptera arizonana TaxID=38151 RepID=A0A1B6DCY7_9HEMI
MGKYLISLCLQRILLPIALLTGCLLRQNGLSFIYLILLLYNPIVPVASFRTLAGHAGRYLKAVILLSLLNSTAQFAFQIVLLSHPPYGSLVIPPCGEVEKLCRFAGLIHLQGIEFWQGVVILSPEVVVVTVSISVLILCRIINRPSNEDDSLMPIVENSAPNAEKISQNRQNSLLTSLGKYILLASLCFAGVLRPSILNGFYFFLFLMFMTWWACNKSLGRGFAIISRITILPVMFHIIVLYLYQMQWAQDILPSENPIARYFGLIALRITNCHDPRVPGTAPSMEWASFVNPIALIWLYFMLWYESRMIMSMPLIRGRESFYRKPANKSKTVYQDSLGSVTVSEQGEESIKLENVPEEGVLELEEDKPGMLDFALNAVIAVSQLIAQSSYIGTNIIMMAWSITYHSWLTFVLLLWAIIMWLLPNQRRAMLRSSPFLLLYAQFLLISQYIYGMDLTDDELPETIQGWNMKQIGFEKVLYLPVKPLLIKTLYTLMFWITLRQHNQERWEARNTSTIADMVAPLQIGVGAATSAMGNESQTKSNQIVQKTGKVVRELMTKYWIWVVASILFGIGITGERMTIFRIIYMALALVFILTFQLSWVFWRKMMYGFWLTVIIYSMLILVMTYTYQFDNFKDYWEKYLGIPPTLQLDIGLERFETTQLFVRLLTPTFFVVITVIQLYYFHKDFLAISDIKSRGTSSVRPSDNTSIPKSEMSIPMSPTETVPPEGRPEDRQQLEPVFKHKKSFHFIEDMSHINLRLIWLKTVQVMSTFIELFWLYLELHMLKFIMLSVILLAVFDVCAAHLLFVVLTVIAMTFGSSIQTLVTHIMSVLFSILLLSKMIYQIEYIKHETWNVTCPGNGSYNTAEWLGFRKTTPDISLPHLLKGYIGVIIVVTLHTVVTTRQKYKRHLRGRPLSRPIVMFPRVTYKEVDKDVEHCVKYLLNYGFYRFGVEICLMAVVALIGTRMDLYAVLYALWLWILITTNRRLLSKVWSVFMFFIVVTIPLQYAFVVGLPPSLCIFYPWDDSEMLQRLQEWMFFPDPKHPPPAYKLICDFIVLLLVCRQSLVFRIERRHEGHEYAGGTNKSVIGEMEKPGFVNPVSDFISHVRSWLDIGKRIVLSAFIWFTLAVVFLTGTNRVNLFSLGYLVGSFIFLWQGNDLYLRPIQYILRWWKYLINYSITVIFLKAFLQILGCIFIKEMQMNACWAVQLFGIACIQKFGDKRSDSSECSVPRGDVGLAWDGFCFGFLILQRRLFNSYYFMHIVDEAKAMAVLASRGAELIEELSQKQIREQQEAERKILEKIKYKMDRIKASQQKIQGPSYKEPSNHHVGSTTFKSAVQGVIAIQRRPSNSKAAIRSGDYYMFEDLDEELDLIAEQQSDDISSDDDEDGAARDRGLSVSKLLSSAMKTDIGHAAQLALDKERMTRRSSIPDGTDGVSRRRSTGRQLTEEEPSTWRSCSSLPEAEGETTTPQPGPSSAGHLGESSSQSQYVHRQDDSRRGSDASTTEAKEMSMGQKIITFLKFIWAFLNSVMISLTKFLNKFSRDYRYVIRTLAIEKKQLKGKTGFGHGLRTGSSMIWQPLPFTVTKPKSSSESITNEGLIETQSSDSSVVDKEIPSPLRIEEMEAARELSTADQPPIVRLCLALWFAIISHSEIVCYFMVFLHQIKSATLLSLPLPIMVFTWGTLTVPRPSKTFWVTIIAYTEIIVVIKCMFQFDLLPWNQQAVPDNRPFFPPRIIGIERKPMYATHDLLLLLVVFFHRSMLKSLGLWNSTEDVAKKLVSNFLYDSKLPEYSSKNEIDKNSIETKQDQSEAGGEVSFRLQTEEYVDPSEYFPSIIPLTASKYLSPAKGFFKSLLEPSVRVTADVYAYMFFCDFFNFLVVIFGFSAFGSQQGDGGVSQYFEENKVPIAFLVMLILQFGLIIVDRTLYLRKFILGKIIFQYVLVIGVHVWMFFVLPAVTERQFNSALPPQIWYMVKCFYLLLSAYQIRSGYPTRILGNFLCKSYNYINMFLFKVFMSVPFVFELRALMDWIWTDTSMTLPDWLKMEDIFAHIFQLKCQRRAETEYPQPRGEKKSSISKYLVGGGCLVAIIAVIWFPLVLFALGNTVGKPNLPYDVTLNVRIGAYQPIYSMSAQNNSIFKFDEQKWGVMSQVYKRSRSAQTFLSNYGYEDIGVVQLSSHSTSVWTISPPDEINMKKEAESVNPITVKLDWTVSRHSDSPEQPGTITDSQEITLTADNPERKKLVDMLNNTNTNDSIIIPNILPKFLKISTKGPIPISQLMTTDDERSFADINVFRNITMRLKKSETNDQLFWWELKEDCRDSIAKDILLKLPLASCDNLIIYTFNDKAFPASLNILSGKGIIGLYTTFVIVVHSFIRGFFTGISFKIMFDDMPNVDRVLQLCLDIYLVRESGELDLEEDLFAKLVFLYRSPETLIKWTRPPEEVPPEEAEDMPQLAA